MATTDQVMDIKFFQATTQVFKLDPKLFTKSEKSIGGLLMLNVHCFRSPDGEHLDEENLVLLLSNSHLKHYLNNKIFPTSQLMVEALKHLKHDQGLPSCSEFHQSPYKFGSTMAVYFYSYFRFSPDIFSDTSFKPIIRFDIRAILGEAGDLNLQELEPQKYPLPLHSVFDELINLGSSFKEEDVVANLKVKTGIELELGLAAGGRSTLYDNEVKAKVNYDVRDDEIDQTEEDCPICLKSLRDGGKRRGVIARSDCSHKFHPECLMYWLGFWKSKKSNDSCCPMCRSACLVQI